MRAQTSTYGPATYGDTGGAAYCDEVYGPDLSPRHPLVELLAARMPPGGLGLELGAGTGRVALPWRVALGPKGGDVEALDASVAMLKRLVAKAGADRPTVHLGDMTAFDLPRRYHLVAIVNQTIWGCMDLPALKALMVTVRRHLHRGAHLVVHAALPPLHEFRPGPAGMAREIVRSVTPEAVHRLVGHYDPSTQMFTAMNMLTTADGQTRGWPERYRYCLPGEIDLAAELAGLELAERHGGADARPFDARATEHVSVYRAPP